MSRILILFIIFPAVSYCVSAQPAEVVGAQAQVNRILEDSAKYFREGLMAFSQSRRADAGEKFDDAVEVFLSSTLNIQNNQQLQSCYTQLIETVYRLEFVAGNQPPQLKPLSATCGWKWSESDFLMADQVVAMTTQTEKKPVDPKAAAATPAITNSTSETFAGFGSKEFNPAIGDELAHIELTQDEQQVEGEPVYSPVASSVASNVKIVRAQSGDTVSKLATRHGADPTEVAKYNGLLLNSILGSGREIKIPSSSIGSNKSSSRPKLQPVKIYSTDSKVPCKNTVKPTVRGLKLGMSTSEVSRILARRLVPNKSTIEGETWYSVSGVKDTRSILVYFYKGSLYRVSVLYDDSIKWTGITEFQKAIAKSLELPDKWERNKYSAKMLDLQCDGFYILVDMLGANYFLVLVDTDLQKRRDDDSYEAYKRRQRAAEEKKKAFKP